MPFTLTYTQTAVQQLHLLAKNKSDPKRYKAVVKTLRFLVDNPRHPSLQTHEFTSLSRQLGKKVFEAYAENRTAGAYRIFWHYGKDKEIRIIAVTPHP
jgi:predicted DCC family thiol-disulfide oxidoreductase YuxK